MYWKQETAQEARNLLQRDGKRIVAMIVDIQLPDGSGLNLLDDDHVPKDVHVLIITGSHEINHVITALRTGAVDYLLKPCQVADVDQALGRYARRWGIFSTSNSLQNVV